MPNIEPSTPVIEALYDSQCPICRFGVKHYELNENADLKYQDMRQDGGLKQEAMEKGFNLNKGVVVKCDGQLYYGGDALHFMAQHGNSDRWAKAWVYKLFRSRTRARLLYPFLSAARSSLLWLRRIPDIHEDYTNGRKEGTIKKHLQQDWQNLHPNIQQRFAVEPAVTEHIFYRGTMDTVECSLFGKLFAHLTRLIANPLTPYEGKNVQMDVMLYRKVGLAGVYWRRTYYYLGQEPYTVTSVKREDNRGNLTECVGGGFGMVLKVSAEKNALVFRSTRYFWGLGKFRINLPDLITPGETTVIHEDLNNGNFRFTITMNHKLLGKTFYQTGVFKEV